MTKMAEEYLSLCADVRAKLYGATYEELKPVAEEVLPLLDVGGLTRANVLAVFEDYIFTASKKEDGGIPCLKEFSEKLKLKPPNHPRRKR